MSLSDKAQQSGATYFDSYKLKVGEVKKAIKELKEYDIHDGNLLIPIKDFVKIFGKELVEEKAQ